ncbi:NAD(P)/FAD-dependent oxidoreductase [Arenimonas sp. GDDSR-1]|uniref:FAD-dependent oxidoreductase n=1 Tax=Arenimonas sp. GDDSR-1 TaxID=2950125 RepID=UPI00261103E7|nr:NAD(P)/FAD-dependent oxidoreductase [Arenimonas sp. GDDSR-1]
MKQQTIHIAGAGLAGALLAILLVQKGHVVRIYEKRPDPRKAGIEGGRSINLALAYRGLYALQQAGLDDEVMPQVVMMRGRMVHDVSGNTHFLRYGKDDTEVIWSVHRGRLNLALIEAAEKQGVTVHFNARIGDIDLEHNTLRVDYLDHSVTEPFERLIGADGAGSAVRRALADKGLIHENLESLGHNYRELEIAPDAHGNFKLDGNSLHIWPRGGFMCIALPNTEKTFTVTLFLPAVGDPGFDKIRDPAQARKFFTEVFPDALDKIADFDYDWQHNPESALATLTLDTWHHDDRIVLIGDAAHAMVPFHGQGMNCAFEDCLALVDAVETAENWNDAISAYESARRENAAAIQTMALENYVEMRDKVDDSRFLLERTLERELASRHPDRFMPRYSMVSFQRVPYAVALQRGKIQRGILARLCEGISDIAEVDYALASEMIRRELEPLHA